MAHLIMLRGLPLSGKSARAAALAQHYNAVVFASGQLDCSAVELDAETITWLDQVYQLLRARHTVVIDGCHTSADEERFWRAVANTTHASFSIEYVATSLQECLGRNQAYGRPVADAVIRTLDAQLRSLNAEPSGTRSGWRNLLRWRQPRP